MKKSIALAGLLFLATTLLAQQEKEMSRVDLYGGYSQAKVDPFQVSTRSTLRGWNGSFGLNAASWLSLVVELGGNYGSDVPTVLSFPDRHVQCRHSYGNVFVRRAHTLSQMGSLHSIRQRPDRKSHRQRKSRQFRGIKQRLQYGTRWWRGHQAHQAMGVESTSGLSTHGFL